LLQPENSPEDSLSQDISNETLETTNPSIQKREKINTEEYSVILLLDNRENISKSKNSMFDQLTSNKVNCYVTNLELGDIMWVAKRKSTDKNTEITQDLCGDELVLDLIVERKKIPDLFQSLSDGRYQEQKFRLKKCGLSRLIYLVEGEPFPETREKLQMTLAETQLDGFFIKYTRNELETVQYLTKLTEFISGISPNHVTEFGYDDFQENVKKNRNLVLQDVFGKQLMQIKGVTPRIASRLVEIFPTPAIMMQQLSNSEQNSEKLSLNDIKYKYGYSERKLGKKLVHTITEFFTQLT